MRQILYEVC